MYPEKFLAKVEREEIPPIEENEREVTREDLYEFKGVVDKQRAKYERLGGIKAVEKLKKEKFLLPMGFKKTERGYEYSLHNEKLFELICNEVSAADFIKGYQEGDDGELLKGLLKMKAEDFDTLGVDVSDVKILTHIQFEVDSELLSLSEYVENVSVVVLDNSTAKVDVPISGFAYPTVDEKIVELLMPLNLPITFMILGHELGHLLTHNFYFKKVNESHYQNHRDRARKGGLKMKNAMLIMEDERLANQYGKNLFRKLFGNFVSTDELELFESYSRLTYLETLDEELQNQFIK